MAQTTRETSNRTYKANNAFRINITDYNTTKTQQFEKSSPLNPEFADRSLGLGTREIHNQDGSIEIHENIKLETSDYNDKSEFYGQKDKTASLQTIEETLLRNYKKNPTNDIRWDGPRYANGIFEIIDEPL